jgi:hypothetical protein
MWANHYGWPINNNTAPFVGPIDLKEMVSPKTRGGRNKNSPPMLLLNSNNEKHNLKI